MRSYRGRSEFQRFGGFFSGISLVCPICHKMTAVSPTIVPVFKAG